MKFIRGFYQLYHEYEREPGEASITDPGDVWGAVIDIINVVCIQHEWGYGSFKHLSIRAKSEGPELVVRFTWYPRENEFSDTEVKVLISFRKFVIHVSSTTSDALGMTMNAVTQGIRRFLEEKDKEG